MLEFEWDDAKARANARKHGVTFERAKLAFKDPFAIAALDDREDYGEERFVLLGLADGPLLFVAYTERGDRLRIISARRATRHEQDIYERENKKTRRSPPRDD
ncbi:MAG TPA: BrnT family toxin [Xanthobacteraceae bacterium]|nr:BrnT family toxin [Xanthobacteraceae bacterium]